MVSRGFRPYIELGKHLDSYRDAMNKVPHHQDMALERDHGAQCIGMQDLLFELRASPVRWMLGLERRRIARLQRIKLDEDDLGYAPEHMPRTLSSATRKPWAYAAGQVTCTYVHFLAHLDDFSRLATCEPVAENGIIERVKERQATYLDESSITKDLQQAERAILNSYKRLTLVYEILLVGSPDMLNEALRQLVKKVDALQAPPQRRDSILVPSYQYHMHCSLSLELIDTVLKTCKKVSSRMKRIEVKTKVSSLETSSRKASEAIQSNIRRQVDALLQLAKRQDLAKSLATPSDLEQLAQDVVSTLGSDGTENHLRDTIVSCRGSLESLLSINIG